MENGIRHTNPAINKINVGRIAERIVSNELEYMGFRVSDLNADSTSANADLLAVGHGQTWQIQVKGASNTEKNKIDWFHLGYCSDEMIQDRKIRMFNRKNSFYTAAFVILVSVRSPKIYNCVVLPTEEAENIVQLNLDGYYRQPKRNGEEKKPGKMWIALDKSEKARKTNEWHDKQRAILNKYINNWDILLQNRG